MYTTSLTDFTATSKLRLPKPAYIARYIRERTAIKEEYDFLDCSITSYGLICQGTFSIPELTRDYEVKIKLDLPKYPKVFVINPKIEFNPKIHMYRDGSLCLHYPKDNSFKTTNMIFDTIIPWTSEWLIFYELYKLKGKWLGKYVRH